MPTSLSSRSLDDRGAASSRRSAASRQSSRLPEPPSGMERSRDLRVPEDCPPQSGRRRFALLPVRTPPLDRRHGRRPHPDGEGSVSESTARASDPDPWATPSIASARERGRRFPPSTTPPSTTPPSMTPPSTAPSSSSPNDRDRDARNPDASITCRRRPDRHRPSPWRTQPPRRRTPGRRRRIHRPPAADRTSASPCVRSRP